MDIDEGELRLGYKFIGDRISDKPLTLETELEYETAINETLLKMAWARCREIEIDLFDLNQRVSSTSSTLHWRGGLKRNADQMTNNQDDADVPSSTITYRNLLAKTKYNKHPGRHCHVDKEGNHDSNDATLERPPHHEDFDYKPAKRAKRPASGNDPTINVYTTVNVPPYATTSGGENQHAASSSSNGGRCSEDGNSQPSSAVVRRPLEVRTVRTTANLNQLIDLTTESNDNIVIYPTVRELLFDLNNIYPSTNFLRHHDALASNGFPSVVNLPGCWWDRMFTCWLDIPFDDVEKILAHAKVLIERAEKGISPAVKVEDEQRK
ncbi:hypothetical protein V5O48_018522 [Marasmius crinis-equi]|uniref:Uncharacterized protein n=1 Tax=Marasmius crinis-equi TaxID=585013 RepID=A0ABR3EKX5_9AGAR